MSQQSEERLSESASAGADALPTARVIHLKTRSDLQRAIQLRAQESVERERYLDSEARRPKPLKWLIISVIAAIPVLLTLTAVDGFLRAFYGYMDVASKSQPQNQPTAEESAAMVDPNAPLQSNEPGVILLQPLTPQPPVPVTESKAPAVETAPK